MIISAENSQKGLTLRGEPAWCTLAPSAASWPTCLSHPPHPPGCGSPTLSPAPTDRVRNLRAFVALTTLLLAVAMVGCSDDGAKSPLAPSPLDAQVASDSANVASAGSAATVEAQFAPDSVNVVSAGSASTVEAQFAPDLVNVAPADAAGVVASVDTPGTVDSADGAPGTAVSADAASTLASADVAADTATAASGALTATMTAPSEHDGSSFTIDLEFSEPIRDRTRRVRGNAFVVKGGSIRRARRLDKHTQNGTLVASQWRLTVKPKPGEWPSDDVYLWAPGGRSCSELGALCTVDGRSLSHALEVTVSAADSTSQTSPDLAMAWRSITDNTPEAGARFRMSLTVRNDGGGASAATTLRVYRSTNAGYIPSADTEVGTAAVGTLGASATSREWIRLTAPSSEGEYYYKACMDAVAGESDTTNNCARGAVLLTVTKPKQSKFPDLEIRTIASFYNGLNVAPGDSFALSAGVRNAGDGPSAATSMHYYRSNDATVTTADPQVATYAVPGLAPSANDDSRQVDLTAPSQPGTYYYRACVDAVAHESDTTNNCSATVELLVVARQ